MLLAGRLVEAHADQVGVCVVGKQIVVDIRHLGSTSIEEEGAVAIAPGRSVACVLLHNLEAVVDSTMAVSRVFPSQKVPLSCVRTDVCRRYLIPRPGSVDVHFVEEEGVIEHVLRRHWVSVGEPHLRLDSVMAGMGSWLTRHPPAEGIAY